jgi:hypothetical protein
LVVDSALDATLGVRAVRIRHEALYTRPYGNEAQGADEVAEIDLQAARQRADTTAEGVRHQLDGLGLFDENRFPRDA